MAIKFLNTVQVDTDVLYVDAANDKVGIGTTSPNTLLDVSSDNFGATAPTVRITNTLNVGNWSGVTSDLGRFEFFTDDTSGNAPYTLGYIGIKNDITTGVPALPSGAMVFATTTFNTSGGAVERMRISSTGNVGIGTDNPISRLDVRSVPTSGNGTILNIGFDETTPTRAKIHTENYNASFSLYDSGNREDVKITTNGDSWFNGGNVGIGTTNPDSKLHIADSTSPIFTFQRLDTVVTADEVIGQFDFKSDDSSDTGINASIKAIKQDLPVATVPMAITFETGVSGTVGERMRIDSTGNVGIGNTNPSDYSADANNLVVGSLSGNNGITILSTASSGYGSLYFADATTSNKVYSGFIRYQQNQSVMNFGTNEVERMRIDVNGNVGIGTTSPGARLEVSYTNTGIGAIVGNTTHNSQLQIYTAAASKNSEIWFGDAGNASVGKIDYDHANDSLNFAVNAAERMRITSSGNVGIGTTSPGGNLHVVGASGNSGRIYLSDKDNGVGGGQALLLTKTGVNSYIYNRDSGDLRLGTDDQFSYVTIKPTGDVGIGTTSPSEKLEVDGNLAVSNSVAQLYINSQASSDSVINLRADSVQKTKIGWDNSNDSFSIVAGSGAFSTANVVVKTNGNVGIGTTSPDAKLEISSVQPRIRLRDTTTGVSSGSTTGAIDFYTSDASSEGNAVNAKIESYADSIYGRLGLRFFTGGAGAPTQAMTVNWVGSVGIGVTSPSAKLHVSGGDIRIDDTEQLQFGAGGVRINNDAAGRMYFNAPLAYYWQAGSGYKMVLLNSGNVGIGTTSPASKLEVDGGDIEVDDSASGLILRSPDGTRYRVTVANGGTLSVAAV